MREIDGFKVGFFGVTTHECKVLSYPGTSIVSLIIPHSSLSVLWHSTSTLRHILLPFLDYDRYRFPSGYWNIKNNSWTIEGSGGRGYCCAHPPIFFWGFWTCQKGISLSFLILPLSLSPLLITNQPIEFPQNIKKDDTDVERRYPRLIWFSEDIYLTSTLLNSSPHSNPPSPLTIHTTTTQWRWSSPQPWSPKVGRTQITWELWLCIWNEMWLQMQCACILGFVFIYFILFYFTLFYFVLFCFILFLFVFIYWFLVEQPYTPLLQAGSK